MVIALLAAVITSFIVPPDEKYLDYFDYKTLACLFSVLAVVCALKNVQFFYILACNIVKKFRNIRLCTVVLVWVTFIVKSNMVYTLCKHMVYMLSITNEHKK